MDEKKVSAIIDEYKENPESIEFEVRLQNVTRDIFETVINGLEKMGSGGDSDSVGVDTDSVKVATIESTVNIIANNVLGSKDETQSIWKLDFSSGEANPSGTFHRKQRIRGTVISGYLPVKISLAKETDISKFPLPTDALVRFKLRYSKQIGDWRIDCTAVRSGTLKNMQNSIKQIRKELFLPGVNNENYLKKLNHVHLSQYEIEIEYVGQPAELDTTKMKIVEQVFSLINSEYQNELRYQDILYGAATLFAPNPDRFKKPQNRLKQLGNQAVSLSKLTYAEIYPPVGYYVTEKADGKRSIIYMVQGECHILASDSLITFTSTTASASTIVADCEVTTGDITTFHIFDVMYLGENLADKPFSTRVTYLKSAASEISKYIVDGSRSSGDSSSGDSSGSSNKYAVIAKQYTLIDDNLEQTFNDVLAIEHTHGTDGLIITTPEQPYYTTVNYKWKPYSHNTIDFLAMKCPESLLGTIPYNVKKSTTLYLLFVGIDRRARERLGLGFIHHYQQLFPNPSTDYYPIQFSPSCNPLAYLYWHTDDIHGKIVELGKTDAGEWEFHRVREDRTLEKNYYGNDYRIAELTYMNFIDRFDVADLYSKQSAYFTKTADKSYLAANRFKRFVISLMLSENLANSKMIIDMAAGRGADLHRYKEIGVSSALFIDIDKSAIAELIRRKFSVQKNRKSKWTGGGNSNLALITRHDLVDIDRIIVKDTPNMTINTLVADLSTPHKELIIETGQFGMAPGGVNGMVCNFALHYLCDSREKIANTLQYVSSMLEIGGVFCFTVMSGAAVYEKLKDLEPGQSWNIYEDEAVKYSIRKDYGGETLANFGQQIAVKLPFTDELYEEPLCNIDAVIKEAALYELSIEQNSSMSAELERFRKADRNLHSQLSKGDLEYIELHSYVTMRKIAKVKGGKRARKGRR